MNVYSNQCQSYICFFIFRCNIYYYYLPTVLVPSPPYVQPTLIDRINFLLKPTFAQLSSPRLLFSLHSSSLFTTALFVHFLELPADDNVHNNRPVGKEIDRQCDSGCFQNGPQTKESRFR